MEHVACATGAIAAGVRCHLGLHGEFTDPHGVAVASITNARTPRQDLNLVSQEPDTGQFYLVFLCKRDGIHSSLCFMPYFIFYSCRLGAHTGVPAPAVIAQRCNKEC